ncbi:50S ribosomal protein L24 [Candidatus Pacearchaeota archaeon]|nr:50S ribosomal protein L24 [Candidatus Pacearchaeota archaeon]
MKNEFSTAWQSSLQPRKQRKYNYNAPLHRKHKFLSANLSKELRKKYGKRNLPLRKGDEVLVMRGFFRKKKAKVSSVDIKRGLATLENLQRTKKDGSKVNVYFQPSKLQITALELGDKKRLEALDRKAAQKISKQVNAQPKQEKQLKENPAKEKSGKEIKEKKNASN